MRTIGTLFSGFGGVDIGAMAAGVTPIWALEYDAAIAAVYRQNIGDHVRVGDILDMNPAGFETPDILHASPPCPNFSQAKAGAVETEADIALAQKVADFVTELLPPFFTLENVYMYRQSQSWAVIAQALLTHGYAFNYWRVNMADYGAPQTRQRMIVIARRDGIRPQLPPQTHVQNPQPALFGWLQRWVSWYEAIADLIPDLPDSEFAPWQLARLPAHLKDSFLVGDKLNNHSTGLTVRQDGQPAMTVVSSVNLGDVRAFIVNGQQAEEFVVDGGNANKAIVYRGDAPFFTVTAAMGKEVPIRAFVVSQGSYGNGMPIYDEGQPHGTVTANTNQTSIKAQIGGRVVQLSLRCLARLQSFPDWYQLPEDRETAARGIGNAVPPLFYQRLAESLS